MIIKLERERRQSSLVHPSLSLSRLPTSTPPRLREASSFASSRVAALRTTLPADPTVHASLLPLKYHRAPPSPDPDRIPAKRFLRNTRRTANCPSWRFVETKFSKYPRRVFVTVRRESKIFAWAIQLRGNETAAGDFSRCREKRRSLESQPIEITTK